MLLVPAVSHAAERRLELLVFGPDDDVFSRYGHAAIRVVEPDGQDRVFNFGITSFNRPGYIAEFLEGRVKFWGKESTWAKTLASYRKWDRDVTRHRLKLTAAQADALVARMERDVKPEFREYVYDTFRENCATRLRDYVDAVTEGAVRRGVAQAGLGGSYRDDVRVAFAAVPGLLVLTEIVPGRPLDAPRTLWERMYRPAVLGEGFVTAGVAEAGVVELQRKAPDPLTGDPRIGNALVLGFAALVAGLGLWARRRSPRAQGHVALGTLTVSLLLSALLFIVALGTNWPDMRENALLFVLPPTDLWLLWPAIRKVRGRPLAGRALDSYLGARLAAAIGLAAATPLVSALEAPMGQRAVAVALTFVAWQTLRTSAPA
jgi:hypothetical protein